MAGNDYMPLIILGIGGFVVYELYTSGAFSGTAATAATTAAPSAATPGIDPATGVPYSQEYPPYGQQSPYGQQQPYGYGQQPYGQQGGGWSLFNNNRNHHGAAPPRPVIPTPAQWAALSPAQQQQFTAQVTAWERYNRTTLPHASNMPYVPNYSGSSSGNWNNLPSNTLPGPFRRPPNHLDRGAVR